ncbi:MAG: branched-chain amino acid aminotransferase [Calditrichaeota bacterium]|nr:MAG: branched-chain amino acid aminotransferase [Calditrichota bacterium]MBL1204662.1 branched-chain amino acid aminotransferase [Calditrichota bacterium]NOG44490.1 branched-chain amino acid aminotransferase [Calditrichota bacterium]
MYHDKHTTVFFKGKWCSVEQASSSLYGQTIQNGNGAIEGLRAYPTPLGTQVFQAYEHFERLQYSCEVMGIKLGYTVDELVSLTYELLDKNNLKNAYIRPLVFLSENMDLETAGASNLFLSAWEWQPYLGDKLLRVMSSSFQKPNPKAFFIEAKISGYYVNSILAKNEAKAKGFDDALLNDMNGYIAEGPAENFFFEKNGCLYTAPKGHILPGITRATIIQLAKELDIPVKEKLFTSEDVEGADGAFFTGTAAEVAGFESLNDVKFKKAWEDTFGNTLKQAYKGLVRSAEAHIVDVV